MDQNWMNGGNPPQNMNNGQNNTNTNNMLDPNMIYEKTNTDAQLFQFLQMINPYMQGWPNFGNFGNFGDRPKQNTTANINMNKNNNIGKGNN